ncbi:MAG: hypothetical protein IIX35_03365, partial [Paraprevotella sp.]|nr:hypothetical protein [Paraprevotella sp.]
LLPFSKLSLSCLLYLALYSRTNAAIKGCKYMVKRNSRVCTTVGLSRHPSTNLMKTSVIRL